MAIVYRPSITGLDAVSTVSIDPTPNGLTIDANQVLTLALSSTSTIGALSNTDWNTFNGKQAAGNYITALTGDATASGPGSAALTLATVNGNVGSFGSASAVTALTVNAKGLITAAASTSIQIAESQVNNLVSDLAGKQATGNYITALTGDATASGPGSVGLTLATVNSNVGSFGSSTSIPSFTVNAKGLITAASGNVVIAPAGTLTGTTLAANVLASSLTSVGTIATGVWQGTAVDATHGGTNQTTWAKGDLLSGTGTNTLGKVTVSTDGTFLKADSTAGGGLSYATPASTLAYRSVTTTDGANAITDAVLVLSGASFTETLPTAVGNTGKVFTLIHNGTSVTQNYTIATTSSQTISGAGFSATTFIMYTNGERLVVVSNGANWIIMEHETKTTMSATTANTFTGTTTNPTKANTPDVDLISWYRDGAYAVVHFRYQATTTTGSASGSGSYLILIPGGLVADTTEVPVQTSLTVGLGPVGRLEGTVSISDGSNYSICGNPNLYDSTHFRVWSATSGSANTYWASTSPWPLGAAVYAYGWVRIPIAGWNA